MPALRPLQVALQDDPARRGTALGGIIVVIGCWQTPRARALNLGIGAPYQHRRGINPGVIQDIAFIAYVAFVQVRRNLR